jgi:hypothetical protein
VKDNSAVSACRNRPYRVKSSEEVECPMRRDDLRMVVMMVLVPTDSSSDYASPDSSPYRCRSS